MSLYFYMPFYHILLYSSASIQWSKTLKKTALERKLLFCKSLKHQSPLFYQCYLFTNIRYLVCICRVNTCLIFGNYHNTDNKTQYQAYCPNSIGERGRGVSSSPSVQKLMKIVSVFYHNNTEIDSK